MAACTLAFWCTVIDQATESRSSTAIRSRLKNPESARSVSAPVRPGPPHPGDELLTESLRAPLGRSLAQTGVEHLAGAGPSGEEGVVAEHPGVAERRTSLLLAVHLDDGRVEVDRHRRFPGPAPSDHARRIVSAITASSWRMWPKVNDRKKVPSVEGAITWKGSTRPVAPALKRFGVIDVTTTDEDGGDQREHFTSGHRSADPATQPDHLVHEGLEPEAHHERGRHEQPGVGHQRRLVEGHCNSVDPAR